jgi:hypothetical protein
MTSGELTVGGRLEGKGPVPRFELIDESNAQMGVTLTFENSPDPDEDTITSVLQLRCDRRFLTANLSAVRWSPRRRQLLMVLDAVDACPTYVPPPPSHMPVWSIVLIAIASAVAAYVLAGCMYMRCVRGTPLGWASCPNHEFWCKGPRVVMRATSRAFSFVLNGCKSVRQQNALVEGDTCARLGRLKTSFELCSGKIHAHGRPCACALCFFLFPSGAGCVHGAVATHFAALVAISFS